jgi:hypothetical protein
MEKQLLGNFFKQDASWKKGLSFLFILFISMNEMDGKTTFGQLFQTRCFMEERTFLFIYFIYFYERNGWKNNLWATFSNKMLCGRKDFPWGGNKMVVPTMFFREEGD